MTYKRIFKLKFEKGYSTGDLVRQFPKEAGKVREIALLQIPNGVLKEMVLEESLLKKIIQLKKKFLGRQSGKLKSIFPEKLPFA